MGVELSPSVLAQTADQFRQRLQRARRLSSHIHLDIMDGLFVPSTSVSIRTLSNTPLPKHVTIHAMVNHPERYWQLFSQTRPDRVFLHAELGEQLLPTIAFLRSIGTHVGLALQPKSPVRVVDRLAHVADQLLVMAVDPGYYHGRYHRHMLTRVSALHKKYPRKRIVVDGHMDTITIPRYIAAGARGIVVGSAVMLQSNPIVAWKALKKAARTLKK